jgi:hypothetical protein
MTFEEDLQFFNEISPSLETEHKGKFVLVKNKENRGIFSNLEDAHKAALEMFGIEEVVIGEIGVPAPLNFLATATG